jgi:GAF domain-containing protein/HAMP domain-containing protein
MSKARWKRPHRSIQASLLTLLAAIVLFTVLAMTVVMALTSQNQGRSAQQAGREVLLSQSQDYMLQLTSSSAREYSQTFSSITEEAESMAMFIAAVYESTETAGEEELAAAGELIFQGDRGQHMNSPEAVSSIFIPVHRAVDDPVLQDILLGKRLDWVFPSITQLNTFIDAVYFATPSEVTRYYPNIQLGEVVPPDFRVNERIWYLLCLPENNPGRTARWTGLYLDAAGHGLVSTVAVPVYSSQDEFLGVVGMDVILSGLVHKVERTEYFEGSYSFLIDSKGQAVALPQQGYLDILGREQTSNEVNVDLISSQNGFSGVIQKMTLGGSGIANVQLEGKEYFVTYSPVESMNWSLGSVIPTEVLLGPVAQLSIELEEHTRSMFLLQILPVSLLILGGALSAGWLTTRRIVMPLRKLSASVQQMTGGQAELDLPVSRYQEIHILTQAFQKMADEVRLTLQNLEQRVADRTRDLERRSRQIQVAAEVARDATANRELKALLDHTVNLLQDRFEFTHAAVYLLNAKRTLAVLFSAGGLSPDLIEAGISVRVGEQGAVGLAASSGQPRIWQEENTQTRMLKPYLPEIRSELALPLKLENQVIGVLLVASSAANAFDEEDITVLQIVADQTAAAVNNARLFTEAEESLQQLQNLYGSYSQSAWDQMKLSGKVSGYRFDAKGTAAIRANEAITEPGPVSLPLIVRGHPIGALEIWPKEGQLEADKQEALQALAERISQAMESARLFEETQERIAREQALNQVITRFSHSLDIDTLLQTAAIEMGRMPGVAEVTITVGPPLAGNGDVSP